MTEAVKFASEDGSTLTVHYEGDLLAVAASDKLIVYLSPRGEIVVDEPSTTLTAWPISRR